MCLTKSQTIEEHRKMWTWIGDTITKEKRIVLKYDYLEKHNIFYRLERNCFLCDYTIKYCDNYCLDCPLIFSKEDDMCSCCNEDSPYRKFLHATSGVRLKDIDYKKCAKYAYEIANLPERRSK